MDEEEGDLSTCAKCGAKVPSDSTYYSDAGEVCEACHATSEGADQAAFQAGDDLAAAAGGEVWSKTTSEVDDQGNVKTTRTSVSVGGPLGVVIGGIMRLFGR